MTHATQQEALAEARELLDGDEDRVHVFGAPDQALRDDECFCRELFLWANSLVIFHVNSTIEDDGSYVCNDCGKASRVDAEA